MRCNINVYGLNHLYSQTFADLNHDGQESLDNYKFDWEDQFELTSDVESFEEIAQTTYFLKGSKGEKEFSEEVHNMFLIKLKSADGTMNEIGCSISILDSYEVLEKEGKLNVNIYVKDLEPYSNPIPGIYIASKEFPQSLSE